VSGGINEVWSMDFVHGHGRVFLLFNVLDDFNRDVVTQQNLLNSGR
jgi:hypothetical protein